jgi:hypothetical protein
MWSLEKKPLLTALTASCAFFWASLSLVSTARAEIMLLVDPFDDTQSLMVQKTDPLVEQAVSGSQILGGEREAKLQWLAGGRYASMDVNYDDSQVLDFIQDPRVQGQLTLTWDGTDATPLPPDLTDGGKYTGLAVDVVFDDIPINLTLTLTTDNGPGPVTASRTLTLEGGIVATTPKFVPFSDFLAVNPDIDPTHVKAIQMFIDGSGAAAGADVTLDNFRAAVPEPASLFLLGLMAIIGLGAWRGKR